MTLWVSIPCLGHAYNKVSPSFDPWSIPSPLAACLMLSSCAFPGYRHIHLLSKDGTSLHPASIFVHICIQEGPGQGEA